MNRYAASCPRCCGSCDTQDRMVLTLRGSQSLEETQTISRWVSCQTRRCQRRSAMEKIKRGDVMDLRGGAAWGHEDKRRTFSGGRKRCCWGSVVRMNLVCPRHRTSTGAWQSRQECEVRLQVRWGKQGPRTRIKRLDFTLCARCWRV